MNRPIFKRRPDIIHDFYAGRLKMVPKLLQVPIRSAAIVLIVGILIHHTIEDNRHCRSIRHTDYARFAFIYVGIMIRTFVDSVYVLHSRSKRSSIMDSASAAASLFSEWMSPSM